MIFNSLNCIFKSCKLSNKYHICKKQAFEIFYQNACFFVWFYNVSIFKLALACSGGSGVITGLSIFV